jgi:hypothetical protein
MATILVSVTWDAFYLKGVPMSMDPGGPLLGGGNYYGNMGPRGPYGAWPGCAYSSLFIILAGILLVCGGVLRMFNQ